MPIIKHWKDHKAQELIIWEITEEETFFTLETGLTSSKIHYKKRLEYLASRLALKILLPELKLEDIMIDSEGKPHIHNSELHFSISHSFPYIAVIIDNEKSVGIDIQTKQDKILRLQSKFLSEFEMELCNNNIDNITLAWCYKEAMYKKYGKGGIDFKLHMPITSMQTEDKTSSAIIAFSKTNTVQEVKFLGGIEKDYCWGISTN